MPVSETTTIARPGRPPLPATPRLRASLDDWVALLKPGIMALIVVTTIGSMAFAAHGWPRTSLVVATVGGMMLMSGASSVLNHWYDRDIDALMERTRLRPVASGRIAPFAALTAGVVLGIVGTLELLIAVGWLAAAWAVAGLACYVLVYTVWLKRSTPQNIVIGGAAGAVPPLVGWAAVTGHVGLAPVALFAIVFLWTPPHFWALSLLLRDDYARADVPMLPVVKGSAVTARAIALYTALLAIASLVPIALGELGVIYAACAAALAGRFLWLASSLVQRPDDRGLARRTFLFSLVYLAALFAAMAVDRAL